MAKKIGILGGGQLGRMFLQSAYNFPYQYYVLDSKGSPCQDITNNFIEGSFKNYDDVIKFADNIDIIGIEIEHVNTKALKELEKKGKTIIPSATTIEIIKDKGLQKKHYNTHNINTPNYYLIDNKSDLDIKKIGFPFVQKLRTDGYDGKGVQIIKNKEELYKLWDKPSVIEEFTNICKEIAIIVAKGQNGEIAVYPSVEMVFDNKLNLVDYLISPANISKEQQELATNIAKSVANSFDSAGIFAIELFIDKKGKIWVNETAPRVHNSGHHTIESSYCSQFEQMLRILANLPLGNTDIIESGAMINIIGADNHIGDAKVKGIDILSKLEKTYFHWYGKTKTSPGRKMAHISILGEHDYIIEKIKEIKANISVISK